MHVSVIRSRLMGAAFLLALLFGAAESAAARPEYLARFQADPFRRAEVDGCATCHVASSGGGARNDFGGAFEAASREITPLLRARFPKHFKFETVTLADGTVLSFSDPKSQTVVVERKDQKFAADLAALAAVRETPLPPAANRMSFFVSSRGPDRAGHLGGLAGADQHCQALAKAAGAGDRTWRAYLSTSFQKEPAVNAGDRIGSGPWYNAKGVLIARGPVDLHTKTRIASELLLTENGTPAVPEGGGPGTGLRVLTGSSAAGTAAVGLNCSNWTSAAEGEAAAGDPAGSWNSGAVGELSSAAGSRRAALPAAIVCGSIVSPPDEHDPAHFPADSAILEDPSAACAKRVVTTAS